MATGDANNIATIGAWQISGTHTVQNLPAISGILWVPVYEPGYWRVQFFIEQSNTKRVWVRTGASASWNNWMRFSFDS